MAEQTNHSEMQEDKRGKDPKDDKCTQAKKGQVTDDAAQTAEKTNNKAEDPKNAAAGNGEWQKPEGKNDSIDRQTAESETEESTEKLLKKKNAELAGEIAKLNDEIAKLNNEKKELTNRLLRSRADFDNYRKRIVKERADARKFRAQDLVTDLLETLDNFKRAIAVETTSADGEALKKGMQMVLTKLETALKKEGVTRIEAVGKPFDPNFQQAVMQEKNDKFASGIVTQVLQDGYVLNGRVIRPAMVKVNS
ncbi:MAG: nucleotide exchange factor GrpE [Sporolactobacillus sp.]|jgi:molecular chaperone GrpE|nr:nucleotide exchange factor GrpE [Sporolactobacillus sp.]